MGKLFNIIKTIFLEKNFISAAGYGLLVLALMIFLYLFYTRQFGLSIIHLEY